ncbi:hypothetical protein Ahy_B05g075599 isoform B [Arachis hypogaea]|uniref:Uncharacterized protein n=1 Tax=Arachis hypogaea TaxID=3818 RepID=A0A444Z1W6_ARAHY|nr:hypothetical protein Ahy_B05g075599 isoform B [Arachis hypogaea]
MALHETVGKREGMREKEKEREREEELLLLLPRWFGGVALYTHKRRKARELIVGLLQQLCYEIGGSYASADSFGDEL